MDGIIPKQSTKYEYIDQLGSQVTDSEDHQWRSRKVAPLSDVGGPFFTQKRYCLPKGGRVSLARLNMPANYPRWCQDQVWSGPVYPSLAYGSALTLYPPAGNSSNEVLDQKGAVAVSRCKPTNSIANISTFLGETVKEGLPSSSYTAWEGIVTRARKSGVDASQQAGSDYLNAQFGWMPFVDELKNFADGVSRAGDILAQLERDAGKVVRRSYYFPLETDVSVEEVTGLSACYMAPPQPSFFNADASDRVLVRRRESSRKVWFSGAFTYYLPTGYDSRQALDRNALLFKEVLGLELTPETVWELAPWSWAFDWVSNAGEVISNATAFVQDGLVMRYGYLMEHTIVKDTYTKKKPLIFNNGASCGSIAFVTETKVRRRANPFGFGVSWSGLSPFQLSIAAALGISRS